MGCSCQKNQNTEKRNDAEIAPTRQGGEGGSGLATTHTGGMGRVMTN
jgi:hypothetical protein